MWTLDLFFFLLLLSLLCCSMAARALEVWGEDQVFAAGSEPAALSWTVDLNFSALSTYFRLQGASSNSSSSSSSEAIPEQELVFHLPKYGKQECKMFPSALFAPELQMRFPELIVRRGICNEGAMEVFLNMHLDLASSFSATFSPQQQEQQQTEHAGLYADDIYLDHQAERDEYALYLKTASQKTSTFRCGAKHGAEQRSSSSGGGLAASAIGYPRFAGVTLRLAIATNREYSIFAGDTPASTLNSVAAVVSRVNGIYMRELGIFFQLVANTDTLFCTLGRSTNCAMLPNQDGAHIVNKASTFFASRKMLEADYDLGHVLTTGSGGIAGLAVLCTSFKAQGTTGMATPVGDAFSVDYVAHEIGHQLNGYHTFKDCAASHEDGDGGGNGGDDTDYETMETAVEPGSGSTIMGYAGACERTNLQPHSDPYFHGKNLEMMREFVQTQLEQDETCGFNRVIHDMNEDALEIPSSMASECRVPLGNYFVLTGRARSKRTVFYQWEEMDAGLQSFDALSAPRFRSWKPRANVGERFFPNLYYLSFGLQEEAPYRLYERLPSAGTRTLRFRLTARTRYSTYEHDATLITPGEFAMRDYSVRFTKALKPLKFTRATQEWLQKEKVRVGERVRFTWTKRGAGSRRVELLVAINTMRQVALEEFDSEVEIKDLKWISLGKVANTGRANLVIPFSLVAGEDLDNEARAARNVKVSYMIRTSNNGDAFCQAFDFVPSAMVQIPAVIPTRRPSAPTTSAPSSVHASAPQRLPTTRPTQDYTVWIKDLDTYNVQPLSSHSICPAHNSQCAYQVDPAQAACAKTTRVIRYAFRAPQTGTYMFTTENTRATCADTTLFALNQEECNDDASIGGTLRSSLQFSLLQNDVEVLFLGAYGDGCEEGTTVSLLIRLVSPAFSTHAPTQYPTPAPTLPSILLKLPLSSAPIIQTLSTCTVPSKWCNYDAYGSPCKDSTRVVGYSFTAPTAGTFRFSTDHATSATTCLDTTLYAVQFDACSNDISASNLKSALELPLLPGQQVDLFVGSFNNACRDGTSSSTVALSVSKVRAY